MGIETFNNTLDRVLSIITEIKDAQRLTSEH